MNNNLFEREIKTIFLDASTIVKYYIEEPGSDKVKAIFKSHSVRYTTSFCLAEALGVFKRKYGKNKIINDTDRYLNASLDLIVSIKNGTIKIEEQNIFNRDTFNKVEDLVKKHNLDISDILQLISIKESILSKYGISCSLITADKNLSEAAKVEGVDVIFIPSK